MGFSPWGHKGSDTPERLSTDFQEVRSRCPLPPFPPASLACSLAAVGLEVDGEVLTTPLGHAFRACCALPSVWSVWAGTLPLSPQRAWGVWPEVEASGASPLAPEKRPCLSAEWTPSARI